MHWQKRFDSLGNILAILTGVANDDKSKKIIRHVISNKINKPIPIKSLFPPVFKNEKDWSDIVSSFIQIPLLKHLAIKAERFEYSQNHLINDYSQKYFVPSLRLIGSFLFQEFFLILHGFYEDGLHH